MKYWAILLAIFLGSGAGSFFRGVQEGYAEAASGLSREQARAALEADGYRDIQMIDQPCRLAKAFDPCGEEVIAYACLPVVKTPNV